MFTKKIAAIIGGIAVALAVGSAAFVAKHNQDGVKAITMGGKK